MQVCISLQTDNHVRTPPLSFLQAGCPSCHPTNRVKALKAKALKANQMLHNNNNTNNNNNNNNDRLTAFDPGQPG